MKKLLLCLIYLCCFFQFTFGQEDEQRYYYDFHKKQLYRDVDHSKPVSSPLKYKAGRDINIEITNFNPIKWEIILEESSTNYFLADTAKWSSRIIFPSIPNAPNAASLPTGTVAQQTAQSDFSNLMDDPHTYAAPSSVVGITSCNYAKGAQSKLNDEKALLQQRILEYKELVNYIEKINTSYNNLKGLPELSKAVVISELQTNFLVALNGFLISNSSTSLGSNPVSISSGDLDLKEHEFNKRISDKFEDIQNIKIALDKIPNTPPCIGYDKLYKEFRDSYDLVQKAFSDFASLRISNLAILTNTTSLYDKLKPFALTDPFMVTDAIPIEKDLHTIIIKTKTGTGQPVVYSNIHVEPKKGFKLDVAPGFFFCTLSDRTFSKHSMDSIHHSQYVQDGVVRDTIINEVYVSIFQKENARLSFGGMIFLQAHSQNPGNWNYGGYLGFGALFNDQARWCGSVGGSLLIGRKQHFNINVGFIISQVDRLSPPYKPSNPYQETIDNIPTYRAWKGGGMLGFSWNL